MEPQPDERGGRRGFGPLGPAIIVAAVVLGPGSIMASSTVGAENGYRCLWVVVGTALLMMGLVLLAARTGLGLDRTPCAELDVRLGRPVAAFVGGSVFLVIACFQMGNNTAVLAAIEGLIGAGSPEGALGSRVSVLILAAMNGLAVAGLLGVKRLYRPVEHLMIGLVLVMMVAFLGNLLFARPSFGGILSGLLPTLPETNSSPWLPIVKEGTVVDPLSALPALIATTLSVAGAFYQAYLVREKGWGPGDARRAGADALGGIGILGAITLIIMITSAAVFNGGDAPVPLRTPADVARQLEPLFGPWAVVLFSIGLLAAAFSSFLVNALIGGALLADGLGLGGRMDGRWTKLFTVAVLLFGMGVAVWMRTTGASPVRIILFAQALTVLGLPALALALLYLATRAEVRNSGLVPRWLLAVGAMSLVVTLVLAGRKAWELWLRL